MDVGELGDEEDEKEDEEEDEQSFVPRRDPLVQGGLGLAALLAAVAAGHDLADALLGALPDDMQRALQYLDGREALNALLTVRAGAGPSPLVANLVLAALSSAGVYTSMGRLALPPGGTLGGALLALVPAGPYRALLVVCWAGRPRSTRC